MSTTGRVETHAFRRLWKSFIIIYLSIYLSIYLTFFNLPRPATAAATTTTATA